MNEPDPCIALACAFLVDPLESCEKRHCPFAWQRRGREDRARREEADQREGAQTVHHKKGETAVPPQTQGEQLQPEGGAVPPHSAGVVPVPGSRVGEPAAPVVGQICAPGSRDGKSLLCGRRVEALKVEENRDVPGAD
jgi:hypothetical protein